MSFLRHVIVVSLVAFFLDVEGHEADNLSVYGPVPGLSPSPYYRAGRKCGPQVARIFKVNLRLKW